MNNMKEKLLTSPNIKRDSNPAFKLLPKTPIKNEFYQGMIIRMPNGYMVKILNCLNNGYAEIEFLFVEFPYKTITKIGYIKKSGIRYPYERKTNGGYLGVGKYESTGICYCTWENILKRVFEANNKDKVAYSNKRNFSYYDTIIADEWYNFQNFAEWYHNYISRLNPNIKYEIDKDILQWNFEQKIYSPNTCCLIPHDLNVALIDSSAGNRDLPIGVDRLKDCCKFKASGTSNGKHVYLGLYDSPEEAFEVYNKWRKNKIIELAEYYFSIGALYPNIKDAVYNIEFLPYGKGRRING